MATIIASPLGGKPQRLNDIDTVGDVKDRLQLQSYTASVNGEPEDDDFELSDEDFVSLSPPVKGAA